MPHVQDKTPRGAYLWWEQHRWRPKSTLAAWCMVSYHVSYHITHQCYRNLLSKLHEGKIGSLSSTWLNSQHAYGIVNNRCHFFGHPMAQWFPTLLNHFVICLELPGRSSFTNGTSPSTWHVCQCTQWKCWSSPTFLAPHLTKAEATTDRGGLASGQP